VGKRNRVLRINAEDAKNLEPGIWNPESGISNSGFLIRDFNFYDVVLLIE